MTELARSLLLALLVFILGAIGVAAALPIAMVGAVACAALLVIAPARSWRRRRKVAPPAPTRQDLAEDPARRAEREAIQRDARKAAGTFRGMSRLIGIEDTPGDVRLQWHEKYFAPLQGRLEAYCSRWKVKVADAAAFVPRAGPVQPEWLEAMARDADLIVWQLDHEQS